MQSNKIDREEFICSAIRHHELSINGDLKGSNEAHKIASNIANRIGALPDQGNQFLLDLCKHENPSVKLWAATYLLPVNAKVAMRVIKELINNDDDWRLQALAEAVLDNWKNKISFD